MSKKKIFGFVIIFIILVIIFDTCSNDNKENRKNTSEKSEVKKTKKKEVNIDSINSVALEKIKEEPKVKDAVITDANVLYVGVVNDGTNRDGYASYCCIVMNELNSSVKRVKVVEFGSYNSPNRDNAYGILLGESSCEF